MGWEWRQEWLQKETNLMMASFYLQLPDSTGERTLGRGDVLTGRTGAWAPLMGTDSG